MTSRNMKGYDRDLFLRELENVPWDLLYISDDPNNMAYTCRENLFLEVLEIDLPHGSLQLLNS